MLEKSVIAGRICEVEVEGAVQANYSARRTDESVWLYPEWVRLLLADAVDHGVRFAYGAAFVAGALERFVGDLTPEFAQFSFGQVVVPEGIGIA